MTRFWTLLLFFPWFFSGLTLSATQARASLGEGADSVSQDQKAFQNAQHAVRAPANGKPFMIHTLTAQAFTVREFVSSDGTVFAVSWAGRQHPDLAQLLGQYFGAYQTSVKQMRSHRDKRKSRHSPFQLTTADGVVVEVAGHMGDVRGFAYHPGLLPSGVATKDLKGQ